MPIYEPERVEYTIANGNMSVVNDDGSKLLGYWAHPDIGGKFPAIALIHDWWGVTDVERRLAHLFAQLGYYVIVPDLFGGIVATNPQEAMGLVESLGAKGYTIVDHALTALENHVRSNRQVAAVGLGMGGSLAFEAALKRTDLEAAVAYFGFPQRYLKHFHEAKAPILAIYGSGEPYIAQSVIAQLQGELAKSPLPHEVFTVENAARDFFSLNNRPDAPEISKKVLGKTLQFLEKHLERPTGVTSTGKFKPVRPTHK